MLDARHYAIDIAAYIGHGPLRAYVMGDRGARNEPATTEDIAAMKALVTEAIQAGAIGFSSSRTLNHKARDGEPVPGTFAAQDELDGLADGVVDAGGGLFEIAPQGLEFEADVFIGEVEMLSRIALRTGLPVTFAMLQNDRNPDSWRSALERRGHDQCRRRQHAPTDRGATVRNDDWLGQQQPVHQAPNRGPAERGAVR